MTSTAFQRSRRQQRNATPLTYRQKLEKAREQYYPESMIPDLRGHVFTLSSQKPERPGNHDLVVGAIAEYLSKNGASEVARGATGWSDSHSQETFVPEENEEGDCARDR